MNLSEIGVRRPVLTAMVFLGLLIIGVISLCRLGLDLLPEIEIPTIAVVTYYPGAGPQEVESQVTLPIENEMATVSGLDKIESTSNQDVSIVTLKFEFGVDLEEKASEVRDKAGLVETLLPDEADKPYVMKFDFAMMPVLIVGVEVKDSYTRMYEYLDKKVSRQLEQLPGVASVAIFGGNVREIEVGIDRQRLEAYRVPISAVVGAIHQANLNMPGGFIKGGPYEYVVRTPEEVTIDQLSRIVVKQVQGRPVFLKDVAAVTDAFAEKSGDVSINQKLGLVMMVQKQSGTNTVVVVSRVQKELRRLSRNLPPDVKLHYIFDQSDFVKRSISSLRDSLLQGGLLVILVIFFFVRDIRSSFIVAASIPISLITTFILMYGAGFTLNLISLSSLGIAVGMVVDASIVVFENILRHHEGGEERFDAVLSGTREVAPAVIASILAVVTVFVPVVFTGGIGGILFRQLAFSFSFTLLCSLFTALTLVPLLSSKFLRLPGESIGWQKNLFQKGEEFFRRLSLAYGSFLNWALSNKKKVIIMVSVLMVASFSLIPLVGTEFMPEMQQSLLTYNVELPIGTRYEETEKVMHQIEKIIVDNVPELEVVLARWGRGLRSRSLAMMGGKPPAGHRGTVMAKLVDRDKRQRSTREIAQALKPLMKFPKANVLFSASDPMASMLFGGSKPLTVEIRGYDLDNSRNLSRQVARILAQVPGVSDVDISRDEGQPEYQIKVRREKASLMNLSVAGIADQVKTYFEGDTTNKFRELGEQYDIMVRLGPADRSNPKILSGVFIATPDGGLVRLSEVADVTLGSGPISIQRRNQERIVEVSGEIYDRSLGDIVSEATAGFRKLVMPAGFSLSFAGGRQEQVKSFRTMGFALILSIILVYMVMASQFESYLDPFVIMFAVPLSLVGVVWSLFLTGYTLSLTSFLGLIMLVGIVEETGIILLSFAIDLRKQGLPLNSAIIQAGQLRLRPILMTSLTTIFGMVPLVLSRGESSEFFKPLAIVIIGGLLVALFATLFFIPVLYVLFEERIKPRFTNA
ncbi:MAG: efflux RND transporter permease subunit [Candidatus Omnitrophota bacterium]